MWFAKFILSRGQGTSIFRPLAKKFKLRVIAYPISSYVRNGKHYFTAIGTILGSEMQKKKAIQAAKKDPRIKKIEQEGNFFSVLYTRTPELGLFYDPKFLYLEPIVIDENGTETWSFASWHRQDIMDFIQEAKKHYDFTLKQLVKKKISTVHIVQSFPKITQKQKNAIDLATTWGYYAYPRKITLKELAKKAKVTPSTFQAHLRKAESKLIHPLANRHSNSFK